MITEILIGAIALAIFAGKKRTQGVGKVKRRIYKEIYYLQDEGIDLSRSWDQLEDDEKEAVKEMARFQQGRVGDWKPSSRSSKSAGEQYYNSLRREYNKITGIGATDLVPTEYTVRNEFGDPVVIYRDYGDSSVRMRRAMDEVVPEYVHSENDAMLVVLGYLADGGKLIWSDKKNDGVKEELFAGSGSQDRERKARVSYLSTRAKGAMTPKMLAHRIWEHGSDLSDMEILDVVNQVLLSYESAAAAKQYIYNLYMQMHTVDDGQEYEDVPF